MEKEKLWCSRPICLGTILSFRRNNQGTLLPYRNDIMQRLKVVPCYIITRYIKFPSYINKLFISTSLYVQKLRVAVYYNIENNSNNFKSYQWIYMSFLDVCDYSLKKIMYLLKNSYF